MFREDSFIEAQWPVQCGKRCTKEEGDGGQGKSGGLWAPSNFLEIQRKFQLASLNLLEIQSKFQLASWNLLEIQSKFQLVSWSLLEIQRKFKANSN